jgi:hypothetical protein
MIVVVYNYSGFLSCSVCLCLILVFVFAIDVFFLWCLVVHGLFLIASNINIFFLWCLLIREHLMLCIWTVWAVLLLT